MRPCCALSVACEGFTLSLLSIDDSVGSGDAVGRGTPGSGELTLGWVNDSSCLAFEDLNVELDVRGTPEAESPSAIADDDLDTSDRAVVFGCAA